MKKTLFFVLAILASRGWAAIPATPVMTLYQFNGALDVPYYAIDDFQLRRDLFGRIAVPGDVTDSLRAW